MQLGTTSGGKDLAESWMHGACEESAALLRGVAGSKASRVAAAAAAEAEARMLRAGGEVKQTTATTREAGGMAEDDLGGSRALLCAHARHA